jgi:hypothetical protein
MGEIAGLFLLLVMLAAAFVAFALLAWLLKLIFKLALFPVALAFGALKIVLVIAGVCVGLVLMAVIGPVLLAAGMVLLPLALLGGLAWAAISAVT